jgi:DNA-binding NarL/FixJ family response regulator
MEPRRIILAHVPRFLREMLERAFANTPGLRIVAEVAELSEVSEAIAQTGAQWVIVSLPPIGELATTAEHLLATHPSIRLVNVATDGSHVTMQWVEPREQTLDEFSMNELIALMRDEPHDRLPVSPDG